MPKPEYLPQGNRNLIIAMLLPPPGYNLEELVRLGEGVEKELRPYWEAHEGTPEATKLDGPTLRSFFFVARGRFLFMGAYAQDPMRAREVVPLLQRVAGGTPGVLPVVQQANLFEQNLAGGRSVDIEITGPDIRTLVALGGRIFGQVRNLMPTAQARPVPSLDLSSPEVHVVPKWEQAAEMRMSARELGYAVDALVDGAYAADYWDHGDKIDLVIKGEDRFARRTQDIGQLYVASSTGELMPLDAVASVTLSSGPEQGNHRERQRAITIQGMPPAQIPLGTAVDLIEAQIVQPLRASGELGTLYQINLAGTADKLTLMRKTFAGDWTGWNLHSLVSVLTSQVALVMIITY